MMTICPVCNQYIPIPKKNQRMCNICNEKAREHEGKSKMQYDDPFLICPKRNDADTNDCVCKKWEEYERLRLEEVAKADLT